MLIAFMSIEKSLKIEESVESLVFVKSVGIEVRIN